MEMENYVLVICSLLLYLGGPTIGWQEGKLYKDLFTKRNYFRGTRPVTDAKNTVIVRFGLSLQSILGLDIEKELLTTHLWLHYMWTDELLKWNKSDYGNIDSLNVDTDHIWIPDITPYNGYGLEYVAGRQNAIVENGHVHWIPAVMLTTVCKLDMTRYPYDRQICTMKFGSWTYDGTKLNLTLYWDNKIDMSTYVDNSEYEIESTALVRNVMKYDCCPEEYMDITASIKLKRRSDYITHIIVSPSIIMALLLPVMFILPPESREKLTFGIGLLITDAVLLLSIVDAVPRSKNVTMPLIGVYHLVNMTLVCISLAITTIVMNIWAKANRAKLLPSWISTFILKPLSKILCVHKDDIMYGNSHVTEINECSNGGDKDTIMTSSGGTANVVEWRQLAIVIDRLCLIIFAAVVALCVIVFASK